VLTVNSRTNKNVRRSVTDAVDMYGSVVMEVEHINLDKFLADIGRQNDDTD